MKFRPLQDRILIRAATEVEVKERKDRVEDAMHATRAAVEEGIIDPTKVVRLALQGAASVAGLPHHDRSDGRAAGREGRAGPAGRDPQSPLVN